MKYSMVIALLIAAGLQSCVSFNRRYEYALADSTAWKYSHKSVWYNETYDDDYYNYSYHPRKYYSFNTNNFTINISRIHDKSNMYSFGPLVPVIPIFFNTDEQNNRFWGIKRLSCELKYRDTVYIKSCYLEINHKRMYPPAFGVSDARWIDGKFFQRFDTNRTLYYEKDNIKHAQFDMRFEAYLPNIETAVLHFDSVYVDGKSIYIPPLSLRKEYVFYFEEELHYLLR